MAMTIEEEVYYHFRARHEYADPKINAGYHVKHLIRLSREFPKEYEQAKNRYFSESKPRLYGLGKKT